MASCLLLFTRIETDVWLRGLILLGAAVVLGPVAARRARVNSSGG